MVEYNLFTLDFRECEVYPSTKLVILGTYAAGVGILVGCYIYIYRFSHGFVVWNSIGLPRFLVKSRWSGGVTRMNYILIPPHSLYSTVRGSRPGKNVQLTENEIRGLCLKSREIFLSQPILLELEAPLKICGKYIL